MAVWLKEGNMSYTMGSCDSYKWANGDKLIIKGMNGFVGNRNVNGPARPLKYLYL